jgi:hypothetical protein
MKRKEYPANAQPKGLASLATHPPSVNVQSTEVVAESMNLQEEIARCEQANDRLAGVIAALSEKLSGVMSSPMTFGEAVEVNRSPRLAVRLMDAASAIDENAQSLTAIMNRLDL